MLTPRNKQPIKVGILEISAQNKALLEFFFSDSGKSYFKEVNADQASCFIIDYDSPGAKESWETTFKESQKPGIIISIKEVDLPSTIWVAKPLSVKALMDASITIKDIIDTENSIKETIITPIEKELEENHGEIAEEVTQHETTPLETEIDIVEVDNIEEKNEAVEAVEAVEQESIQETITAEYQIEDGEIVENIIETIKEKPELVLAGTSEAASSTSFAVSSDQIDVNHGLRAPDLFLDDKGISSTTPIDKTEIDKGSKNEGDEIDSLLESLISEEKTDSSLPVKLFKSEAPEKNHNVVEITPKITLEDFDLVQETVATELKNDVQSNEEETEKYNDDKETIDESVTKVFEANDSTDAIDTLINDLQTNANIINNPKGKNGLTSSKPSKKSAEDELQNLLEEIRHEANEPSSKSRVQRKTYLPTMADERWKLICGENKKKHNLQSLCTITPHEYILSSLLETIKQTKETNTVSRVKFKDIIVVIDPSTDSVYCNESIFSDYYATICHAPISKNDIKIHQLDESEIRLYRNKIEARDENAHLIESFIWTTSLVTYRGYLPIATDINKKVGLKYWPNLTRLENMPHSIQIAAVFHKCSKSLSEITNELDIPKKYIIAFYNAALSLGLIEQDERKHLSASKNTDDKPKNRGFFSRILQKLGA